MSSAYLMDRRRALKVPQRLMHKMWDDQIGRLGSFLLNVSLIGGLKMFQNKIIPISYSWSKSWSFPMVYTFLVTSPSALGFLPLFTFSEASPPFLSLGAGCSSSLALFPRPLRLGAFSPSESPLAASFSAYGLRPRLVVFGTSDIYFK